MLQENIPIKVGLLELLYGSQAYNLQSLSTNAVRRIADELTSVADGRYDWRIVRFMRSNGMSR